ncbi:hypothetical protein DAPPUDRAFT_322543 [Daphnia pulex]|uniref:Annexin n=1 Tax=Daphnia pulex TaxID=6669 RepID=E9GWB8_DAPPU|nr:hypothetical protein DAPPUDRAFT_322543 [Daphnia pulex]|eukprot:EFX76220.1 hypothetical protein DAPPUDRAFT_322543 [Daphnia pulex]
MGFLFIFFVLCFGTIFGQDLPTLVPAAPFDPNSDAARLFDAMNGLGTDENKIISVLCYRTASQRDVITTTYNNQHGSLAKDLQSELTGSFQTLSIMLTHGMIKFLSIELHETMARPGTDEPSLTEVIMSRSNQELDEIETFFNNYYGHSLVSEIEADTTGSYRQLLIQMAEGRRDETMLVNMTAVQIDVVDLYEGGPAIDGTDENLYINIFTLLLLALICPFKQNQLNNSYCINVHELRMLSSFAVQYSADKALYFSSRFHTTIAGAGTADRDLMRLTVSRCETDLGNIKIAYQNIYGVSLSTAVSDDTSGSYRTALLALID